MELKQRIYQATIAKLKKKFDDDEGLVRQGKWYGNKDQGALGRANQKTPQNRETLMNDLVKPTASRIWQGAQAGTRIINPALGELQRPRQSILERNKNTLRDYRDAGAGVATIAGLTRLPAALTMSAFGTALTSGMRALQGQPITSDTLFKDTVQNLNRSIPTAGVLKGTTPLVNAGVNKLTSNIASPITGVLAERGTRSVLNVGEGLAIDQATGLPTTLTSVGLDAAFGLAGGSGRVAQIDNNVANAKGLTRGDYIDARDMEIFDQSVEIIRNKKKFTPDQLQQAVDFVRHMGEGYLDPKKLPESADVNTIIREVHKISKNVPSVDSGMTMGIKGADDAAEPLTQEARKSAEELVKAKKGIVEPGNSYADLHGVNPESTVTIYRGVKSSQNGKLTGGEWVTQDKELARLYSRNRARASGEDARIISQKVKAKDLIISKDTSPGVTDEFIYTPNAKSQLTDIYNQATKQEAPKGPMMGFVGGNTPTKASESLEASPIQARTQEIASRLQKAQEDLTRTQAYNDFVKESKDILTGKQRQAIASMQKSIRTLENKGLDPTNVSGTKTYQKHIEDIMAMLKTDREDVALDFVRNYEPPKTQPVGTIKNEVRALDKELEGLQAGVYKTPSGTVHFDPSVDPKPLKTQAELAEADYREWSRNLYKETVKAEKQAERGAIKTITDITRKQTTSPAVKNIDDINEIGNTATGFADIYRNMKTAFGKKYDDVYRTVLKPFEDGKQRMFKETDRRLNELDTHIVQGLGIKPKSAESAAVQEFGEGTRTYDSLVKEFGDSKAKTILDADQWFRKQYDDLLDEVNAVRAKIYPDDATKIIPKRKDYYRHFTQMQEGFAGLKNIFDTPAGISPSLSGISQSTKPKSKWLSIAQRRLGMRTEIDAVSGFLDYVRASEYAKNVDPHIGVFRNLAEDISMRMEDTPNPGRLNNLTRYLHDYANELSGKTSTLDRAVQDVIPGGRKAMSALNWLNSRVKANVILGNASSSVAQFFNIPQGVANAGPKYAVTGAGDTLVGVFKSNESMSQSKFINERYFNSYDKFDTGMLSNVKKFAVWMTQVGDEIGTKYIWNMHHKKALSEGIEDAVGYADAETRRLVAGRGIGEVPIVQKSKVFQLIAPFQLEVANLWHVMKDMVDEKQFGKLATLFVTGYLMNKGAEKVRGSGVMFDPIQATIDAYGAYNEEDDKLTGAMRAGGRITGEVLSNVPLGQTVASIYPEYGATFGDVKIPTRQSLFGEGDPTRFGSGLFASKGLQDPLYKVLPPFGGAQIKRTIEGLGSVDQGYAESKSGKVQYPIDQSPRNYLQAGVWGKYSLPEAQDYFDNKRSVLGDGQTEVFNSLGGEQAKEYYNSIIGTREKDKAVDKQIKAIEEGNGKIPTTGLDNEGKRKIAKKKVEAGMDITDEELLLVHGVDKLTSKNPTSSIAKARHEKDLFEKAVKIFRDDEIDEDSRSKLVEALGVNTDDLAYYDLAADTATIKSIAVQEAISGVQSNDRTDMLKVLVDFRREVSGERVLSDTMIDDLVKDEILSKEEGKLLKDFKYDTKTGQVKIKTSGRGKSAKIKNIKFVPMDVKFNNVLTQGGAPEALQAPRGRITPQRIQVAMPQAPQQPKFQVRFNL